MSEAEVISLEPSDILPTHWFEYKPLDQEKHSIRLIRVKPELVKTTFLKFELRHATTEEHYACLSYVWGDIQRETGILIDHALFTVRRNLYSFLSLASRHPLLCRTWLWIDAICIDQSSTLERNHQVQQMGHIFSKAVEVIAWLGTSADLASLNTPGLNPTITSNPYWDRAWITQEIALARYVTIETAHGSIPLHKLPLKNNYSNRKILDLISTRDNLRTLTLPYMLYSFRHKKCQIPRDRVFSLLALASFENRIQVDYGISERELACKILRASKDSLCLSSVHIIGAALGIRTFEDRKNVDIANNTNVPFAEVSLPVFTDSCDSDSTSETNGVRHKRLNTSSTDTIDTWTFDLGLICDQYTGDLTVRTDSSRHGFQYFFGSQSESTYRNQGFSIILNPGMNLCTIQFTFEFLLEVTRLCKGYLGHYCATVHGTKPCGPYSLKICKEITVSINHNMLYDLQWDLLGHVDDNFKKEKFGSPLIRAMPFNQRHTSLQLPFCSLPLSELTIEIRVSRLMNKILSKCTGLSDEILGGTYHCPAEHKIHRYLIHRHDGNSLQIGDVKQQLHEHFQTVFSVLKWMCQTTANMSSKRWYDYKHGYIPGNEYWSRVLDELCKGIVIIFSGFEDDEVQCGKPLCVVWKVGRVPGYRYTPDENEPTSLDSDHLTLYRAPKDIGCVESGVEDETDTEISS